MNNLVASAVGEGYPPVASFMHKTQQSLLFPALLKQIDSDRRLQVLEIGPALPETTRFFSDFKCRLHFAAMFSDPVLGMQSDDITRTEFTKRLKQSFKFPRGTVFDLCLFWDFLNYLDEPALRSFNTVIKPYIHDHTRAHAFAVRTPQTSIPHQQYGIEMVDKFKIRPRLTPPMACFPHPQNKLLNLLTCFDIDKGMLLPDGRLEILMTTRK